MMVMMTSECSINALRNRSKWLNECELDAIDFNYLHIQTWETVFFYSDIYFINYLVSSISLSAYYLNIPVFISCLSVQLHRSANDGLFGDFFVVAKPTNMEWLLSPQSSASSRDITNICTP